MKPFPHLLIFPALTVVGAVFGLSAAESTHPVSAPVLHSASAAGNSFAPLFSRDGRSLVFLSHANNLVTNDDRAPWLDVFVCDLVTSNLALVSVNPTGVGGGNTDAHSPSISFDGRFIAFESAADNFAANDANHASDIFVRDRVAGTTTLASVSYYFNGTGTGASTSPQISGDGRYVAFVSAAVDLVTNDFNRTNDVFVRDLQTGVTTLVSVSADGAGSANAAADSASISADGRWVAFVSRATNLVADVTNGFGEIFLRDLASNTTVWVSSFKRMTFQSLVSQGKSTNTCADPVFTPDGRYLFYKAGSFGVFRYDLQGGTNAWTGRNIGVGLGALAVAGFVVAGGPLTVSDSGRFVSFENGTNVFLMDLDTLVAVYPQGAGEGPPAYYPEVTLVSYLQRAPGFPATGVSYSPRLSADGQRMLYLSDAKDLIPNGPLGRTELYLYDRATGTNRLIVTNPGQISDANALIAALSPDGVRAAFDSLDGALMSDDYNQAYDVFLRNLDSGDAQLISRALPETPPATGVASVWIGPNSISADGRFVAYTSLDNVFEPGDTNHWADVFVRDLWNGTNVPVHVFTIVTNTGLAGDNYVANAFPSNTVTSLPALSADGRYLAQTWQTYSQPLTTGFYRRALIPDDTNAWPVFLAQTMAPTNLVPTTLSPVSISSNGLRVAYQAPQGQVFVAEFDEHGDGYSNWLVSVNLGGVAGANVGGSTPIISGDGRWVAFLSISTDLVTNPVPNGVTQLFVRDLLANQTLLANVTPAGLGFNESCTNPVFSADQHALIFTTVLNTGEHRAYLYDLVAQTNTLICTNCNNPSPTGNARLVAYQTSLSPEQKRNIYVKDILVGDSTLVSCNSAGLPGNGDSTLPQISPDGRFVVFASKASDLVDHDTNNATDIFVRDRVLGVTLLASMNRWDTASGNGPSGNPVLGPDGRTVVFQSFASDLVDGDYNDRRDVFVLKLGGLDSDGDGMDDDWEVAYFGNLSRDGTGDFDSDGVSDFAEFRAGTDPTNGGSILRVLTLTPLNGGAVSLIWSAVPGRTYRVQFKDDVADANWTDLPGLVTASGTTASASDPAVSAPNRRFYRVVLAP